MVFQEITSNSQGKFAKILYPINGCLQPLRMMSPSGLDHWGITAFDDQGEPNMAVPYFPNKETPEIVAFKGVLQDIDVQACDFAYKNQAGLFAKKKSRDSIEDNIAPCLKTTTTKTQITKFKLPKRDDSDQVEFWDKATMTPREPITKGDKSTLRVIFSIDYFWAIKNQYGIWLTLRSVEVDSPRRLCRKQAAAPSPLMHETTKLE